SGEKALVNSNAAAEEPPGTASSKAGPVCSGLNKCSQLCSSLAARTRVACSYDSQGSVRSGGAPVCWAQAYSAASSAGGSGAAPGRAHCCQRAGGGQPRYQGGHGVDPLVEEGEAEGAQRRLSPGPPAPRAPLRLGP